MKGELVEAQIATLTDPGTSPSGQTLAPTGDGGEEQMYRIPFTEVVHALNGFWQTTLAAAGLVYREPSLRIVEGLVLTACGPAGPEYLAFYCPPEEAIYYAPAGLDAHRRRIGDFAPIVVLAHEWGHHLQALFGVAPEPSKASELHADCLAGAYASHAGQRGLLDPGDITEAVAIAATMGDPLGLPQDTPGAHGINDERITAFMRGYLDGSEACDSPLDSPHANAQLE